MLSRVFFIRVLTGMGCIVTLVKDGEALLNELADKAKNYDLIITDNTMPKVKGIEALKRIREVLRRKDPELLRPEYLRAL